MRTSSKWRPSRNPFGVRSAAFVKFAAGVYEQNRRRHRAGSLVSELKQHTAIPPAFTKHLKSLDLAEGTQMMFECHVSGVPTPAVSWHRGDECIDNAPDYVITKINGMCCLKIRKVAPENSARYTCRATNGGGEAASSATLNVIGQSRSGRRRRRVREGRTYGRDFVVLLRVLGGPCQDLVRSF